MSDPGATRWLRLTVAYDGGSYAGWQRQPDLPTVQGTLEAAWRRITGEEPEFTASGRTDAGVHAEGQVVGAATRSPISPDRLAAGLNAVLPDDVVVVSAAEAPPGFHATHDALRKTYRYQVHDGRTPPLFDRRYVWWFRAGGLDEVAMGQGGARLVGRHDFAAFETTGSERASTVRTITALGVERRGPRIDITVTGDGFLYNMVRSIAGTLVEVGRGAQRADWVSAVLASRDRSRAGQTAPAQGLVLLSVEYPQGEGTGARPQ